MFRFTIPVAWAALVMILPATPGWAGSIDSDMRKEDSRLNKVVTISARRIYIGDLLELLTKQTSVALSAGRRDGSENAQIFINVRNIRLGDCLDGIWSLLSYKRAEYRWERTGEPGKYEYHLLRPVGAQKLAERLRSLAQTLFEQHAERMLAAAEASPHERETIVRTMVGNIFGADESLTNGLLASERCWSGLATFSETLSRDDQLRVLRGQEERLRVPLSKLSEKGHEFVLSVWKGFNGFSIKADGTRIPLPEPEWVQFKVNRGLTEEISPSLYIDIQNIGGYAYLGGMPLKKAVRKRVREMWFLPDDHPEGDDMERKISAEIKNETVPEQSRALEVRLKQLADYTPLPIIARLPHDAVHDPGSPLAATLRTYVANLQEQPPRFLVKWRNGILLADYPSWFHDEDYLVPLQIVKQLRKSASEHDGYLTMVDILEAAQILSPAQLRRLGDEFPAMFGVAELREILVTLCPTKAALSQLDSAAGIPLSDRLIAALGSNLYFKGAIERGSYRAITIQTKEHLDRKPPVKEHLLGLTTLDGKWIPVTGVMNIKNETNYVGK